MGQYEWLVLTCRACRRVIKLAPAMAGKHVICPHCRTKISVPKDAPVIEETAEQSFIPTARATEEGSSLRGREEWEVGQRPIGGELQFKEMLHSTADPAMKPYQRKKKQRANPHRRHGEDAPAEAEDGTRRRKQRRKVRSSGAAFAKTFTQGLVIAVLLLLGMVGWLAWEKWHRPKPEPVRPPEAVQQLPTTQLTPGADGQPKLETRHFGEYGAALETAARRFAAAPTVDELLPLLRDRTRVEPKVRAYYSGARAWQPLEINNKFQPDDSLVVDGDFIVLELQFPNGDSKPVTFERTGETFLADWESFTGYGELPWEELREQRPQQPVLMRVVVERSVRTEYWDGVFSDHTTHHCFLLRDMDSNHFLSGYTVKDSPTDIKLRQFLQPAPPPANNLMHCFAVVRLSYPANSENRQQVLINEVLEKGWVFRADQ